MPVSTRWRPAGPPPRLTPPTTKTRRSPGWSWCHPATWNCPTAPRCAEWAGCPPNSPTSPRSSTGACAWSGWCWSGCGPRARSTQAEASLAELARLAETAGSQVLEGLIQRRSRPDAATYIGSGKAQELADIVTDVGADTVICDGELSPGQLRQLEGRLKVKVVDRTALILDIFAQHASSKEGKAQVELAQLEYLLPRLRGWGDALSRQAGGRAGGGNAGVGLRGPGETKLEIRPARHPQADRQAASADRRHGPGPRHQARPAAWPTRCPAWPSPATPTPASPACSTPSPARACWSRTRCSPPSTRPPGAARPPDGLTYTLTDTVGFVRHLPHQLVEAFRSTLEEVADADLVLHVVDGSDPMPEGQVAAVREVLAEISRARRGHAARADGGQQDRRRRRVHPGPAAQPAAGRGVRLGPHRRRHRRAARPRSPAGLPHPSVRSTCWCRSAGATWWPGCTPRAR